MFAIPGQTLDIWRETLLEATAMGSEHLSSYEVIYEEDTALYARLKAHEFEEDENLACAMYEELVEHATSAGLRQYEVANFAREIRQETGVGPKGGTGSETVIDLPGFACHHNVNYWRGGSFYGLGPSATSYVRGVRSKNWPNTQLYCERVEGGGRAIESCEELPPLARAGETAAFGLRMIAGWPFEQFRQITGHDLRQTWRKEMERLSQQGWGMVTSEGFQLTSQGLRFADAAAELFLR